jgi:hypothetical protein
MKQCPFGVEGPLQLTVNIVTSPKGEISPKFGTLHPLESLHPVTIHPETLHLSELPSLFITMLTS